VESFEGLCQNERAVFGIGNSREPGVEFGARSWQAGRSDGAELLVDAKVKMSAPINEQQNEQNRDAE
jgi:hypothetical protein